MRRMASMLSRGANRVPRAFLARFTRGSTHRTRRYGHRTGGWRLRTRRSGRCTSGLGCCTSRWSPCTSGCRDRTVGPDVCTRRCRILTFGCNVSTRGGGGPGRGFLVQLRDIEEAPSVADREDQDGFALCAIDDSVPAVDEFPDLRPAEFRHNPPLLRVVGKRPHCFNDASSPPLGSAWPISGDVLDFFLDSGDCKRGPDDPHRFRIERICSRASS